MVADAARVAPGSCVLDVACGTGPLTLAVADRVAQSGSVVGLDGWFIKNLHEKPNQC